MPSDPYTRPVDEQWFGEGGREPESVPPNFERKSLYRRDTNERWYGPPPDESGLTLAFQVRLLYGVSTTAFDCFAYMKESGGATCYPLVPTVGALTWTDDGTDQRIIGDYTSSKTFEAWRNQLTTNFPQINTNAFVSVTNTGTAPIFVNAVQVDPGNTSSNVIATDAGYGTGDQSAFGGGAIIAVTAS